MDTKIYYIPKYHSVLVTSNFDEIQKRMDIGMDPKIEYINILFTDMQNYISDSIGFNKIENKHFQEIKEIFSNFKFKTVAFDESSVDLLETVLDVEHLIIGEKSKVDISQDNFKNLQEITFLSLKTYKGKFLTKFSKVKKLVIWHENKKVNSLLENFPELKVLNIFNGSETNLDLRQNNNIEKLELANFPKLEHVFLNTDTLLKEVEITNCKKLSTSNLPIEVPNSTIDNFNTGNIQSTGNKDIDKLIIDVKINMENYMVDWKPSYSQPDIDECILILIDHAIKTFKTKSKEEAIPILKSTISKLNDLNKKCNSSLIETQEREQLVEIIILVGYEMGYNDLNEDITEDWREW